MKVLRKLKWPLKSTDTIYPAELINADSTSQQSKTNAGWKQNSVARGLVLETFPEGIIISEYARIRILTMPLRVRWK